MEREEIILSQLNRIKEITHSDVLTLARIESNSRKLVWSYLLGAREKRTEKIKQSVTAGLTMQALRTGKPQKLSLDNEQKRICFGEAIMITEQLSHIYIWPIVYRDMSYQAVIICGKRGKKTFADTHLEQASVIVQNIEQKYLDMSFHN